MTEKYVPVSLKVKTFLLNQQKKEDKIKANTIYSSFGLSDEGKVTLKSILSPLEALKVKSHRVNKITFECIKSPEK